MNKLIEWILYRPASGETIGTLRSCRDHWKISFEHERANVIRLRKEVYHWHNFNRAPCQCDDCQLVRQFAVA